MLWLLFSFFFFIFIPDSISPSEVNISTSNTDRWTTLQQSNAVKNVSVSNIDEWTPLQPYQQSTTAEHVTTVVLTFHVEAKTLMISSKMNVSLGFCEVRVFGGMLKLSFYLPIIHTHINIKKSDAVDPVIGFYAADNPTVTE